MRLVLTLLPYPDKDEEIVRPPDKLIVGTAADVLEADELPESLRKELVGEYRAPTKRPKGTPAE